mmetsp:Transcript_47338/g.95410  ORF Transcript_47338/g.95410 Transcript_47338/m.95410 type:complete len:253 (-) Transcript_47338:180-938(-)
MMRTSFGMQRAIFAAGAVITVTIATSLLIRRIVRKNGLVKDVGAQSGSRSEEPVTHPSVALPPLFVPSSPKHKPECKAPDNIHPVDSPALQAANEKGGGKLVDTANFGGGTVGGTQQPVKMSARDAAAAAGLRRRKAAVARINPSVAARRQKQELVGQIEARYATVGKDPPIGLGAASSIEALRRHLEYIRSYALDPENAASHSTIFEFKGNTNGISGGCKSDLISAPQSEREDGKQKMTEMVHQVMLSSSP